MKIDLVEIANIPYRNAKAKEYSDRAKCLNKKKSIIVSLIIGIALGLVFGFCHVLSVEAKSGAEILVPIQVEMTYYLPTGNVCANGKYPRKGIVAFQREYIGYTALIYSYDNSGVGSLIGIYEIYDTGFGREELNGNGTIQNGNCVDIFVESDEQGKELIKKYGNKVMIQLVDGKG